MAIVRILTLHLTGAGRQQVLQGPKAVLNPVAPLPRPDEPRSADSSFEAHHVELLLPGFIDYEECHGAICRTGRPQPRIAYPRHLLALPPRPIAVLLQVVAFNLPPIKQIEDI